MSAMSNRHLYTAFQQWLNVIDSLNTNIKLDPYLESIFSHTKQDIVKHDKNTKKVRESWNTWKNPLDNAVQTMEYVTSQYGKRWVAKEIIHDGRQGARSVRSGVQVSSNYREPLNEKNANSTAADPSEINIQGITKEQGKIYMDRYQIEYKKEFAKRCGERAEVAAKVRKQEYDKMQQEIILKKEIEEEQNSNGQSEDTAFSYCFDYYSYLNESKKLTLKIKEEKVAMENKKIEQMEKNEDKA